MPAATRRHKPRGDRGNGRVGRPRRLWLLILAPSGAGYALVAERRRFTESDEVAYLVATMAALPSRPPDPSGCIGWDDRALVWRFDPPQAPELKADFYDWMGDPRQELDTES